MLIDTHIHLQDNQYASDRQMVLQRAAEQGVSAVIVPGTDFKDSKRAIEIAQQNSVGACEAFAAVGVHPTEADSLTENNLQILREMASYERIVAIGEIGLDYYWPNIKNRQWACAEPAAQRRAFELQLNLASDLNLPVIVHNREAHQDTLAILKTWLAENPTNRGVLHSYSCGTNRLAEVVNLGLYVSLSGPITYKKNEELRQVASLVPESLLLIETDGPYLPPVPYRGKRNESQYLHLISEQVAQTRNITPEEVAQLTTLNALRLFNLTIHAKSIDKSSHFHSTG